MFRFVLTVFVATTAWALPPERSSQGTDDDASVTVSVLDRAIRGDVRSWCSMRILIRGEERALRRNDTVRLRLIEDDLVGDDTLWGTDFEVTRDEANAQRVDRRFDCSANFGDGDARGGLEIYAVANVDKQECGGFCNDDDPTTGNIDVSLHDDDDAEDDDDSASAAALPLGVTPDRIARDADWFAVNFLDRSQVTFRVAHRPAGGRVDLVMFEPGGGQLQVGDDLDDGAVIQTAALPPGEYRVRTQPRDGRDYNFYDVELRVVTAGCEPGSVEVQPCGNCGNRRRECGDDADWRPFGECEGSGTCAPGDARMEACGLCGHEAQTCTEVCAWERGECADQGECTPGDQEAGDCPDDGGVRVRECTDACAWAPYGECDDAVCAAGDVQDCYEGPEGTADVGVCKGGRQACEDGAWGPCEGEVRPTAEVCDDGVDNDCDGDLDQADEACDDTVEVGDACDGDDDCGGDLECLRPPQAPGFLGGYCGISGCDDDCPGDAICGTVFGERYCLQPCERHSACRADYRCADVAPGRMACIPACQRDVDCRDPAQPLCDRREGLCVAEDVQVDLDRRRPPRDMGRPPPRRDMGGAGGAGGGVGDAGMVGPEAGEAEPVGCSCDVGRSAGAIWWALLLFGVRRRRS